MNVRPNQTLVKALVKKVSACQDGQGHDLDLEILENRSPDPSADFLQPKVGDRLTVYAPSVVGVGEGEQIQATLGLAAGPLEQRTILRKAERMPVKP